jgi:two-component system phosphate regulon sensor histidine kinase PhoR
MKDNHLELIRSEMESKLGLISIYTKNFYNGNWNRLSQDKKFLEEISKIIDLRITIVKVTGEVIADTDVLDPSELETHLYRSEISRAINNPNEIAYSSRLSHVLNIYMIYAAKMYDDVVVRVSKPLTVVEKNLNTAYKTFFISFLISLIFAIGTGVFISYRITNPIQRTIRFAQKISDGNFSDRIHHYSEDEVGVLQKSLNKMTDTLMKQIKDLTVEQRKLKITLKTISDGIAVISKDKKIILANNLFLEMLDIPDSMLNRQYFEMIRSRTLNAKIEEVVSSREKIKYEEKFFNGIICEITLNPIIEDHQMHGVLIVMRNETEKKKIEKFKSELVANMSHELKTPITIMKGYLETISENIEDGETAKVYISKAIENVDRQNLLINDILKLNMLESKVEFPRDFIDIKEVILNCIKVLEHKISDKKIDMNCSISDLPERIAGNKFLSEEVFFNLIDNAINYSRNDGKIEIFFEDNYGHIKISVRDFGIGIPIDSIDRIFERFYRVEKSRSRDTGGTGLGLAIVYHAVELLDWKISVISDSVTGTVFTVEVS